MVIIADFKDNICNPSSEGTDLFIIEWTGDNPMGLRPLVFRSNDGSDLETEVAKYLRAEFEDYADDEVDDQLENFNYHHLASINQ